MPALESDLRRQLESVVIQAREAAENAARSALVKRAVDVAEPFPHFGPKEKDLRNRLRARGRQVGDIRSADKKQSIDQLTQELAYEFWHRMLFARFLAENHLLMHPEGVAVSLEECEELARDADPPAPNGFVLAARYASRMLPQIFRTDDVLLEIDFALEQRLALEKLLASLAQKTFLADDSLGWVYQFWQSKKKDEVNKSGDKIDGRTLPAVTQLFTEHYMVQFLLHNTIGAWWCGRRGIQGPAGGAGVPVGKSPVEMEYLRWRDDGTPAAGTFEGWPKTLAEFTMLDPCCGSGHFLVSGFNLLVPLRMRDEKLSAQEACKAVLRDNLFGLELDPRCTQIAAFTLALAAWKYPGEDGQPLGYRQLPPLNIACSGQGVTGKKEEWLKLANGDEKLRNGMDRLYDLFQQAPHLGSLIDPRREKNGLYEAGYTELQPLLVKALAKKAADADLVAVGVAAQGIARAAELLDRRYTLVMTNVPYLTVSKHGKFLRDFGQSCYPDSRHDLATIFVERCLPFALTTAVVTPQNWLFLPRYKKLRQKFLKKETWHIVCKLGPGAFETISGEVVKAALVAISRLCADTPSTFIGVDVSDKVSPADKAAALMRDALRERSQADQLLNPDARVILEEMDAENLLIVFADSRYGLRTADSFRFLRSFWEISRLQEEWVPSQGTVEKTIDFGGREQLLLWENGKGGLREFADQGLASLQGGDAWGKQGVTVSLMGDLPVTRYTGEFFDNNCAALWPKNPEDLSAVWAFCSSREFAKHVRILDQKMNVTSATLLKVPFDLAHWQAVAAEKYPNGLPEPHSDDPTQWLFKGDIAASTDPPQVAVARLLGYRWPDQPKELDAVDALVDADGIVCLPGVRGEAPAAERLLEILTKGFQPRIKHDSNTDQIPNNSSIRVSSVFDPWPLLSSAGCKAGTTLDDWLRNQFFEQHCKRFHNRPFIWHIWDGRKDGFSALVNYHKLDHKALENLTYSYLGDWITAQGKSDKAGADSRLGAAQKLQAKLKLILAGEPPYDIFVRWKPLHEQAIGWRPDLNDGVRMNIRPFVKADVFRKPPNIKWTKDRGKEPERDKDDYPWFNAAGERVNDVHLTNADKQAARSMLKARRAKP
ncbi:MAG TPA: restriction endonuclease subunit M [Planctomycetales bacterium]|jgi:hypothetical protein|nr:restriction endonuclease subunit M [Planctomycetales bacterium]